MWDKMFYGYMKKIDVLPDDILKPRKKIADHVPKTVICSICLFKNL